MRTKDFDIALRIARTVLGSALVLGVVSFACAEEPALMPEDLELIEELGVGRKTLTPVADHVDVLDVQVRLPAGYVLANDVTSFLRVRDRAVKVITNTVRVPIPSSSSPEQLSGKIYYCGKRSTLCKLYQFEHTVPKGGVSSSTELVVPPEKIR